MTIDFLIPRLTEKLEWQGLIDSILSRVSLKCPYCSLIYWILPGPYILIGHPQDWDGRYVSREHQLEATKHLNGCMEHQ